MKRFFAKISIILILLLFSSVFMLLAQAEIRKRGSKTGISDTSEVRRDKLPSEAEEIQIGEEGITIRTKDGKEIRIGKGESDEDISLEEDKIKIGEMEIDLEHLKDSLKKEMPKIKIVSPQVHVHAGGEDIVKFAKDVAVEEDETIDGSVVTIGGNIEVKGTITKDAVAVGGNVWVDSTGVIEGDAVSVGGEVKKESGAVIRGQKTQVSFGPKGLFGFPHSIFPSYIGGFSGFAFFARIIKIIFFLFVGIVVISIVPKNVAKVKDKIKQDFLKSALVGFAAVIMILPVFILLIITIIGIPIAILIYPLLVLAALILGYTAVSYFIGEKLRESTGLKLQKPIMTLVVGMFAVYLYLLLSGGVRVFLYHLSPFPFNWIGALLGWVILLAPIAIGLGAAILTRLGTRPKEANLAAVPVNVTKNNVGEKPSPPEV
jgi:hypothetical protein